jgi:hypothetical protein
MSAGGTADVWVAETVPEAVAPEAAEPLDAEGWTLALAETADWEGDTASTADSTIFPAIAQDATETNSATIKRVNRGFFIVIPPRQGSAG